MKQICSGSEPEPSPGEGRPPTVRRRSAFREQRKLCCRRRACGGPAPCGELRGAWSKKRSNCEEGELSPSGPRQALRRRASSLHPLEEIVQIFRGHLENAVRHRRFWTARGKFRQCPRTGQLNRRRQFHSRTGALAHELATVQAGRLSSEGMGTSAVEAVHCLLRLRPTLKSDRTGADPLRR